MKLTREEAQSIVWGDNSAWETIEINIEDTSRWSIQKGGIFKHLETDRYYSLYWSQGATECQDELPFEYESEVVAQEVVQKEVTVKKWVGK